MLCTKLTIFLFLFSFQLSSSDHIDHSIDLTLGNFCDAAAVLNNDAKQFIGITNFPTTPVATRPMPPLAYPQPKQSSSAFASNGLPSSQSVINSRTYNNSNNINNNNNISNSAINNVNNYQQQKMTSSSAALILAPPPPSRANNNTSSNSNNPFVRPSDNKPLINGRSGGYATASQPSKHEVNIAFRRFFLFCFLPIASAFICTRFPTSNVTLLVVSVYRQEIFVP